MFSGNKICTILTLPLIGFKLSKKVGCFYGVIGLVESFKYRCYR